MQYSSVQYSTVWQDYSITVLQYYIITVLQFYSITVLQYNSAAGLTLLYSTLLQVLLDLYYCTVQYSITGAAGPVLLYNTVQYYSAAGPVLLHSTVQY